MTARRLMIAAAALCAALAAGCVKPPPRAAGPAPYYGPTERLDAVLARVNANNDRIATLNGDGRYELWINDAGEEHYVRGEITLLHTKPSQLRLIAKKFPLDKNIFDLGANADRYWFDVPQADTLWYGKVANAARVAGGLPISPTMVADVLGVGTLDADLLAQPVPMVRFNPDYRAYMLTWAKPVGDRWVVLREVWYDYQTFEPRRIWLFDTNGRVVLRGVLSDFKPLDTDEPSAVAPPRAARKYDLFFPESRSRLSIQLDDLRESVNGTPNRLTYRFTPDQSSARKKIDLDATPTTEPVNR